MEERERVRERVGGDFEKVERGRERQDGGGKDCEGSTEELTEG